MHYSDTHSCFWGQNTTVHNFGIKFSLCVLWIRVNDITMILKASPACNILNHILWDCSRFTEFSLLAGAFLFCWTPFFVVHTTRALCETCEISHYLMSTVTWLGYVNSALNPIIYTVFNAEFRRFFHKILHSTCCYPASRMDETIMMPWTIVKNIYICMDIYKTVPVIMYTGREATHTGHFIRFTSE